MWRCEHSVVVKASKAAVWSLWTNVEKWPTWDTDLSEAALLGDLEIGVEGKMKVADDALVSFTVTEVVPEQRLVTQTRMFGAKLSFIHELAEDEGGIKITHRAELSGIMAWMWRFFVAKKVKSTLAPALDNLAKLAAEMPQPAAPVGAQPAQEQVPTESEGAEAALQASDSAQAAPVQDALATQEAPGKSAVEGDPKENELRDKDIHEQIEQAAKAEVPEVEKPQSSIEEQAEPAAEAPAEQAVTNDAPGVTPPATQEAPAPVSAEEKPAQVEAPAEPAAEAPAEQAVANDAPGVTPPATQEAPAPVSAEEKPAQAEAPAEPAAEEKPKE